jgi:adenylate cyclase
VARIFLSYARDDADAAKQLAACISDAGHDVWWDRHLHGGSRFAAEI